MKYFVICLGIGAFSVNHALPISVGCFVGAAVVRSWPEDRQLEIQLYGSGPRQNAYHPPVVKKNLRSTLDTPYIICGTVATLYRCRMARLQIFRKVARQSQSVQQPYRVRRMGMLASSGSTYKVLSTFRTGGSTTGTAAAVNVILHETLGGLRCSSHIPYAGMRCIHIWGFNLSLRNMRHTACDVVYAPI